MAEGDMLDFSDALSELQMGEEDLQNLIAQGDLRAFRSGGTMKFRRADIDMLKKERSTEPTIIIPAAGAPPQVTTDVPQDLGVDEAAATVVPESAPGGAAPTVQLSDTQSGTEEIVFEDSDLEILPLEGDASAATAEVTVTAEEPVTVAPTAPTVAVEEEAGPARPSRRASRRRGREEEEEEMPTLAGVSRRTQAVYAKEPGAPVWTAFMVVTSLAFVFMASVFGVILWKGYYNTVIRDRFMPGYLRSLGVEDMKDIGKPERQ